MNSSIVAAQVHAAVAIIQSQLTNREIFTEQLIEAGDNQITVFTMAVAEPLFNLALVDFKFATLPFVGIMVDGYITSDQLVDGTSKLNVDNIAKRVTENESQYGKPAIPIAEMFDDYLRTGIAANMYMKDDMITAIELTIVDKEQRRVKGYTFTKDSFPILGIKF
jgi:hypothetical protein